MKMDLNVLCMISRKPVDDGYIITIDGVEHGEVLNEEESITVLRWLNQNLVPERKEDEFVNTQNGKAK